MERVHAFCVAMRLHRSYPRMHGLVEPLLTTPTHAWCAAWHTHAHFSPGLQVPQRRCSQWGAFLDDTVGTWSATTQENSWITASHDPNLCVAELLVASPLLSLWCGACCLHANSHSCVDWRAYALLCRRLSGCAVPGVHSRFQAHLGRGFGEPALTLRAEANGNPWRCILATGFPCRCSRKHPAGCMEGGLDLIYFFCSFCSLVRRCFSTPSGSSLSSRSMQTSSSHACRLNSTLLSKLISETCTRCGSSRTGMTGSHCRRICRISVSSTALTSLRGKTEDRPCPPCQSTVCLSIVCQSQSLCVTPPTFHRRAWLEVGAPMPKQRRMRACA